MEFTQYFLVLFASALACFVTVTGIFTAYIVFIMRTPKKRDYLRAIDEAMSQTVEDHEFPKISILLPAYNEEKRIEAKLKDVAAMEYPRSKLEIILIDDSSNDGTGPIAERTFRELRLSGKIVRNMHRTGVNGCYNRGLNESTGDLIATTDVDVMVDHEALVKSARVLHALRDVGGVTSRTAVVSSTRTAAVMIERPYRDFYDAMCVAESAVHSTFPGYTAFALVRRTAFPKMPLVYGSSDGNISLAIIRKGLRYICVPTIHFYERITEGFPEQARQKTRRGARQIQSVWIYRDLLFRKECGSFGSVIFPLRLLMIIVSPILSVVGSLCLLASLASVSIYWIPVLILFLFVLYAGNRLGLRAFSLLWSLVVHECYLLVALIRSLTVRSLWRPSERRDTRLSNLKTP